MDRNTLVSAQDIDYLSSLAEDRYKDLMKDRQVLTNYLIETYPSTLEGLLTEDERRILRMPNNFVTVEEKAAKEQLINLLKKWRTEGCLEGEANQYTFKVTVEGLPFNLCFDLEDIFLDDANYSLFYQIVIAKILIDGEFFQFPFTKEESAEAIRRAQELFPDLKEGNFNLE